MEYGCKLSKEQILIWKYFGIFWTVVFAGYGIVKLIMKLIEG